MVSFRVISEKDWEKLPAPKPPAPPNPWDEVLGQLAEGKVIQMDVEDDKVKGVRIGLARSAANRGMKLEFRQLGGTLSVKKKADITKE